MYILYLATASLQTIEERITVHLFFERLIHALRSGKNQVRQLNLIWRPAVTKTLLRLTHKTFPCSTILVTRTTLQIIVILSPTVSTLYDFNTGGAFFISVILTSPNPAVSFNECRRLFYITKVIVSSLWDKAARCFCIVIYQNISNYLLFYQMYMWMKRT